LTFKRARIETGELSPRSFYDYRKTCEKMTATFGRNRAASDLRPDDFEALRKIMAKGRGPIALGGDIIRARMVFGFCFKHGLLDKPMRFGAGFVPPNRKTIRKALASKGPRMFDAADLRKIIDAAGQPMRAMILIAANSGMGNCDVAKLPMRAVDLERGWIDFPREKTATPRRFPLWPETIAAIQDSLLSRPTPKECHEEYVFLTRKRGCWADDSTTGTLGREFAKLVTAAGVKGRTFYDIRRTFQTIGEEAGETATRFIMGHVDGSMSARYRQRIADGRLQAVTDHVRAWLFATAGDNGDGDTPEVKGGGA
jgi:integrase